jgi:hypothetical protein
MKYLMLFVSLFVCSMAFAGSPSDSKIQNFFCELAIQTEWLDVKEVRKWVDDIKIYKSGEWPDYMTAEFNVILAELNELIQQPEISVVGSRKEANSVIHLGTADEYLEIEPRAPNTEGSWSYYCFYHDANKALTNVTMFVDMHNSPSDVVRRHLLREKMTQTLGLLGYSEQYEDSIFYWRRSEVTSYSEIDRLVIKLLYRPEIKPGMDKSAARKLIRKEKLIEKIRTPEDDS